MASYYKSAIGFMLVLSKLQFFFWLLIPKSWLRYGGNDDSTSYRFFWTFSNYLTRLRLFNFDTLRARSCKKTKKVVSDCTIS